MSILIDMLETGLEKTAHPNNPLYSLIDHRNLDDISDEFKIECENLIINFMVQSNSLLTEQEIASESIGEDLWLSLTREYNSFYRYQNGHKLKEVVEKFYGLDLESKLIKAVGR